MHRTPRRRSAYAIGLLMALAAAVVQAVPSAADHAPPPGQLAGSGSLEGTETFQDEVFTGGLCFKVTRSVFRLRGAGTYKGRTSTGQEVVYKAEIAPGGTLYGNGPLQVEVENSSVYYHGPYGTHGTSDTACGPATAGSPVPAAFRIFAAEGAQDTDGDGDADVLTGAAWVYRLDGTGAKVPCRGEGTFARTDQNADPNWRADWTLNEDCVVVGNQAGTPGTGVAKARTAQTQHGTHAPCFLPPCVDNIKTDYKQYPPIEGFNAALSGPTSASVATPVTITATVTNDGAPVANAAVTFSANGAGPAAPPGGAAVTGADGRATFTFTAAVAGAYTVSASATNAVKTATASHTVSFSAIAAAAMTAAGPARAQTEESVLVSATMTNAGRPMPAALVDFRVAGPGTATPASGSSTTDANGRATFTFAANRAGDYSVTATATHFPGASATHAVYLDINTFRRVDALTLASPEGESPATGAALVDAAGEYGYFAAGGRLVKVDLRTFQRVGAISPGVSGRSAVIDPAGDLAYIGGSDSVVRVDLNALAVSGTVTSQPGEVNFQTAVIDPAGQFAYFGTSNTDEAPARVVKIDLASFQRVGSITLAAGETQLLSAVMGPDGSYAYFATEGNGGTAGRVVKIDLNTFQRVGALTLNGSDEGHPVSAVIDPTGSFAYFGMSSTPRVVKVDLTAFQRVGAVVLPTEDGSLETAVIDPAGNFAYFGAQTGSGSLDRVIKVDLAPFERVGTVVLPTEEKRIRSAVMAPDGTRMYLNVDPQMTASVPGGPNTAPARIVRIAVSRPPVAWLVAGNDAYSTPYASPLSVPAPGVLANDDDTQDNDPLSASLVRAPARGDVNLNVNGAFTYTPDAGFSGTDTFTYAVDDAMNVSAPATVSIAVGAAPQGVQAVSGSAFAFQTNVSLFGGPASVKGGPGSTCGQAGQPACADGESPAVSLPASGGQMTATDPDGNVGQYGPAYIFENRGPLTASASGSTGPSGSVTASAVVDKVEDNDPFSARSPNGRVSSTCTAGLSGLVASSRITNGRLVVHTNATTGEPTEEVAFPDVWDPAPNTTYEGSLDHIGDRWRMVFNEQILGADSITVNAVHMYLLGTSAVGDMIIGQSRCGITQAAPNTAPVATADSYTATAGRSLTVAGPGVLANDTDPENQALRSSTLAPIPPPSSGGGTWTFPSDPDYGTLRLGADGSFTYTPEAGFTGTDTFTYLAQDARGRSSSPATVTVTVNPAGSAVVADFNGDARTDIGVFRPSEGVWYVQGVPALAYGAPGDVAVPGDYDGDAKTDVAVYRPSQGAWYINKSGGGGTALGYGGSGDVPVPGDYDGDAKTDIAVFRPAQGVWYIRASAGGDTAVAFGANGDVAVPADYDGDGRTDIAVFRPAQGVWYIRASTAGDSTVTFGTNGDVAVVGDYDGDARADIAVFRPSAGVWFVRGGATTAFGTSGDVPVPGDYDGNGRTDMAVFRPSAGVWFVQGGAATAWGTSGDVPLALPAAAHRAMGTA